jgi:hypothetical protein
LIELAIVGIKDAARAASLDRAEACAVVIEDALAVRAGESPAEYVFLIDRLAVSTMRAALEICGIELQLLDRDPDDVQHLGSLFPWRRTEEPKFTPTEAWKTDFVFKAIKKPSARRASL